MKIWYEALLGKIRKVELERETNKFVILRGHTYKDAKDSDWRWFRPTFKEAKQCLIDKKTKEIASAKRILTRLEFELEKINQLKEEDC